MQRAAGILQGIYDFDKESSTEHKEWAVDASGEYFGRVVDVWKEIYQGRPPLSTMESFVKEHCPTMPNGSRSTYACRHGDLGIGSLLPKANATSFVARITAGLAERDGSATGCDNLKQIEAFGCKHSSKPVFSAMT
jgi:hypothetical protein